MLTLGKNVQLLPYRGTCHPLGKPCYYLEQEIRTQHQVPPYQQTQTEKFFLLMLLFNFTIRLLLNNVAFLCVYNRLCSDVSFALAPLTWT